MKLPVVYIDPQSYRNLAVYDHSLLANMDGEIHYVCSALYDYKPLPTNVHQHKLFHYSSKRSGLLKALSYLWSYCRIAVLMLRWRPAVVHVQWLRMPAFDVRFLKVVKRMTRCRLVFTAHNVLPHDTGSRYAEAYGKFYNVVDAIIVHTRDTRQQLQDMFHVAQEKVSVIEHGLLQPPCNHDLLDEHELEQRYQLEGKMVFAALGYQSFYKGSDMLAEVWATTPELYQNACCKLLLVGKNKGVDLSKAKDIPNILVEDRITTDEEFYYLMSHTSVYVLPYRNISQSGALLTAIALGVPFLVTEVGGLAEPLDVASVGWCIAPNSPEALRQQLLWLLHHHEEVAAARDNKSGWDALRQHYDWGRIALLTQQVYQAANS